MDRSWRSVSLYQACQSNSSLDDYLLFNVYSVYTIFYSSHWSIWRSIDLSSHIWNQYLHSFSLGIYALEIRYKRTSFSRYWSRSQIQSNNVKKINRRDDILCGCNCFSFLNTQASLVLFVLIPIHYLIPSKYYWLRSNKNK